MPARRDIGTTSLMGGQGSLRRGGASWFGRIGVLALGTAIGHGSMLLALPALTRIYGPEAFGGFGVFAALAAIVALVAALRYEYALPLCRGDRRFANLRRLCLILAVAAATTAAAVGAWVLPTVGDVIGLGQAGAWAWLIGPCVLGSAWMQIGTFSALRAERIGPVAACRAIQGLVTVGCQLALGWHGGGAEGLIIGYTVGTASAGAVAVAATRAGGATSRREMLAVAGRYRMFPYVMSWSAGFNAVGLQLPVMLLAACFGGVSAGRYLVAQRILSAVTQLVGTSAGQDFYGRAGALVRERGDGLADLVRRTEGRLLVIGLLVVLVLGPAAWWYSDLLLGDEWGPAGRYLVLLLPAFCLQLAVSPVSGVHSLRERHVRILKWNASRAVAVAACIAVPWALGADAATAIGTLSIGYVVTFIALHALVVRTASEGFGDR